MKLGERCDTIIRLIEQALEEDRGARSQAVHRTDVAVAGPSAQSSAASSSAGSELERP